MLQYLLGVFVLLVSFGALAAFAWVIRLVITGQPILPAEPRRPVPWGLGAVLMILALALLTPSVALVFGNLDLSGGLEKISDAEFVRYLLLTTAGRLAAVPIGAALLILGWRATSADLGVAHFSTHFWSDVRLGVMGLLVCLVPVFALQLLLHPLFEHGHELIEALQKQHSLELLLVSLGSAVVAAPIVEEFAFRLVLQGWLEKLDYKLDPRAASTQPIADRGKDSGLADGPPSPETLRVLSPADEADALAPPAPESLLGASGGVMPIGISSLIFAAMHLGQGAAPISLLPLAVVLGYLYYRTHRLLPCIMLHVLFNLLNMGLLWMTMFVK